MNDPRSGAQHLVDALKAANIETIFSLSGNQIMPVYDALIGSGIRLIHTRHEGAAVYMAEAHAQSTGGVGIALLTAGPGFANGLSAMYTARESQTPMVVLTGDAPLKLAGRGAFQEMDQQTAAGALAKASYRAARAEEMHDLVRHAISLSLGGIPGPVHISLPDDVLRNVAERNAEHLKLPTHLELAAPSQLSTALSPSIIQRINAAKRPLIIGGPQFARTQWEGFFRANSRRTDIPMIALESPRGLRAPRNGALAEVLPEADLIVLISLTPDFLIGFGQSPTFSENAAFICFSDEANALDEASARLGAQRVTPVPMAGLHALLQFGNGETMNALAKNSAEPGWRERVDEAIAWRPPAWREIPADAPPFHAASVAYEVAKFLEANSEASLIIDGGEVGQWCQSILDAKCSLINGPSGAIGGSIPYAIAARAARPDQPSIAMLGDGTAGFYFIEFETALRENLPFVAIVGNDAKWNAEHQIQIRDYGENRTFGCEMHPTRYDEMAKAMGCYGENITAISEVVPAIKRAIDSGRPACLNIAIQSIPAPSISRR
jgi:acetolactate synthase-1/2/3 large subunit